MKRGKRKSSGINFNFRLSNRAVFTILGVLVLILGSLSVYAYGTSNPSSFGHSVGELDGLGSLATKNSVDWNSEISNIPSGFADGVDNTGSVPDPLEVKTVITTKLSLAGNYYYTRRYINLGEDNYGSWNVGYKSDTCDGNHNVAYTCPRNSNKNCQDRKTEDYGYYRSVDCRANYVASRY